MTDLYLGLKKAGVVDSLEGFMRLTFLQVTLLTLRHNAAVKG